MPSLARLDTVASMWARDVLGVFDSPTYRRDSIICAGNTTDWDSHMAFLKMWTPGAAYIGFDAARNTAWFHLTGMGIDFAEIQLNPGCSSTNATWGGSYSFPGRGISLDDSSGTTISATVPRTGAPLYSVGGFMVAGAVWPGDHASQNTCYAVKCGQASALTVAACAGGPGADFDLSYPSQDDIDILLKTNQP